MNKTFSLPLITPNLAVAIVISLLMCGATFFQVALFEQLALYGDKINRGEMWRLLSGNLVHFGWAHTLMNCAALLLCTLAFFTETSLTKFLALLLWCSLAVGGGIYVFNPEYTPYAGLSGVIHGLIIAGLLQTHTYPLWIRGVALTLIAAKLVQENTPGYEATDLQQLIPAAVAVESHVYGAIAGAVFFVGNWLLTRINRNR